MGRSLLLETWSQYRYPLAAHLSHAEHYIYRGREIFIIAGIYLTILNLFLKTASQNSCLSVCDPHGGTFMILINAFCFGCSPIFWRFPSLRVLLLPFRRKGVILGLLFGLINWVLNTIFRK